MAETQAHPSTWNAVTTDWIVSAAIVTSREGQPTSNLMYFLESTARNTKTTAWLMAEAAQAPYIPKARMASGVKTTHDAAPITVVFMI